MSVTESRVVSVKRQHMVAGQCEAEDEYSEQVEVELPPEGTPIAEVTFGRSETMNLGNYNSRKVEVRVSLPCVIPELNDAMTRAIELVNEIHEKETD